MDAASVMNTTLNTSDAEQGSGQDVDFVMVVAVMLAIVCLGGGVSGTIYTLTKFYSIRRHSNTSTSSRLTFTFRQLRQVPCGLASYKTPGETLLWMGGKEREGVPLIYKPTPCRLNRCCDDPDHGTCNFGYCQAI